MQSDSIMDKIVHQKITTETLRALKFDPSNYKLLLDASIEPDKHYERAIENIRSISNEEVRDIESRYDSIHSDSWLDSVRIWLSKYGRIALTWSKSAASQLAQYASWATEHGPNAKNNATSYFDIAHTSHGSERLVSLDYCLHYIADLGTPYHTKRLGELLNVPSGTPKELQSRVMENLLNFVRSVYEDHKRFEMELSSFWNTRKGEIVCQKRLNIGFNSAETKRMFTSIAEAYTQFGAALADVEKTSTYQCEKLDKRFSGRQMGEELSQEDRKFILDTSLSSLVKIGEASYIATKAILSYANPQTSQNQ